MRSFNDFYDIENFDIVNIHVATVCSQLFRTGLSSEDVTGCSV